MKHAYLIIAHGYFNQLKFLVQLLDHPDNTIFIMVDKKVEFSQSDMHNIRQNMQYSEVVFIDRVAIYWGDYSIVEAMMNLFIAAYHHDNYQFFHLLSGQDLPLKNINLINQFFEKYPNKNFITLVDDKIRIKNRIDERVKYYHFLAKFSRQKSKLTAKLINAINKVNYRIQKLAKVDRIKNITIKYGSNWVSLNRETVKVMNNHQNWIADNFKYTICPDELFIPTLLNKHHLLDTIYYNQGVTDHPDELQGNLRYINWWQGNPHVWTPNDINQLEYARKHHFFSRKFDLEKYPELKAYIININKNE